MAPTRPAATRWVGALIGLASVPAAQADIVESAIERVGLDGRWQRVSELTVNPPPGLTLETVGMQRASGVAPQPRLQSGAGAQLSYRWWLTRGRADVGVGVGTLIDSNQPRSVSAAALPSDAAPLSAPALPSNGVVMVGMRFRATERSVLYADASRLHGLPREDLPEVYTKVGVEFKSAESRWNIAYGGLGMRFAGDTKMTLRLRKGGLNVVMRRAF